jgi:hypothetical protein
MRERGVVGKGVTLFCSKCNGEMFESGRSLNKITMKCDDCGKQESVFPKREIEKSVKVPMWKFQCGNCKKIFVGNKNYCSIRCFYLKNPLYKNKEKRDNDAECPTSKETPC